VLVDASLRLAWGCLKECLPPDWTSGGRIL